MLGWIEVSAGAVTVEGEQPCATGARRSLELVVGVVRVSGESWGTAGRQPVAAALVGWPGAVPRFPRLVEAVAESVPAGADVVLRGYGLCPPPTVHVLREGLEFPYPGILSCRPFYRGVDAENAIASLGAVPAWLSATHVVVVWEHADLCTALRLPYPAGRDFPNALMVLMAAVPDPGRRVLGRHVLVRHGFDFEPGPLGPAGLETVLAEWSAPTYHPDCSLPEPITTLLYTWRVGLSQERSQCSVPAMERAGYRFHRVQLPELG